MLYEPTCTGNPYPGNSFFIAAAFGAMMLTDGASKKLAAASSNSMATPTVAQSAAAAHPRSRPSTSVGSSSSSHSKQANGKGKANHQQQWVPSSKKRLPEHAHGGLAAAGTGIGTDAAERTLLIQRTRAALVNAGLVLDSQTKYDWLGAALDERALGFTSKDALSQALRAEGSSVGKWLHARTATATIQGTLRPCCVGSMSYHKGSMHATVSWRRAYPRARTRRHLTRAARTTRRRTRAARTRRHLARASMAQSMRAHQRRAHQRRRSHLMSHLIPHLIPHLMRRGGHPRSVMLREKLRGPAATILPRWESTSNHVVAR